MEKKKSLKADLEKMRGVYFLTGVLFVLTILLAAFNFTSTHKENELFEQNNWDEMEEEIIPITRQEITPPKAIPEVVKFSEVEDDLETQKEFVRNDYYIDEQDEFEIILYEEKELVDDNTIYKIVDSLPTPPPPPKGRRPPKGANAFRHYIIQQLNYPETAKKSGIEGTVYMAFVVSKTGKVENVRVIKGIHTSLNDEAVRVISSSPPWTPGKLRGKPVNVEFVFPIKFKLE